MIQSISARFFYTILCTIVLFSSCKKEEKEQTKTEKNTTSVQDTVADTPEILRKVDWSNKQSRQELLSAIRKASEHGLRSSDYKLKQLDELEAAFELNDTSKVSDYYLKLSVAFNTYYKHLYNGKLDPKKIHDDWDLEKKKLRIDSIRTLALEEHTIAKTLEAAAPKHIQYQNLKKALSNLEKILGKEQSLIELDDKLFVGSKHPVMTSVKKKLLIMGDLKKADVKSVLYEESILKGVKNFQRRHGIDTTGIIERNTVQALNISMEDRKKQIVVNMERWRWFPRAFGIQYLLINIPEYSLQHYLDGKIQSAYRVITGTKERKTPVLSSKIQYVVWNPTWTVPYTILKEDYLPELQQDKDFLKRKNIGIYDKDRKEVKYSDWKIEDAYKYKYVQGPGDGNILGQVKFIFENKHFIYLHDTKVPQLFEMEQRNLSSGCIRVDRPVELAMQVSSKMTSFLADEKNREIPKTKNFNTDERLNVHILYWTAWANNSGIPQFRKDVYELDDLVYNALKK